MPYSLVPDMPEYTSLLGHVNWDILKGTKLATIDYPQTPARNHTKIVIIENMPQAQITPSISYALLVSVRGDSTSAIWYKPDQHRNWLPALTPEGERLAQRPTRGLGWALYHFSKEYIESWEELYNIMEDKTWHGFRFSPKLRQKVFYHKRVGYRIISPRPRDFIKRLRLSWLYFQQTYQVTKDKMRPPIYTQWDPERWEYFIRTIKDHPWTRPTPGGVWYVSKRPGDPETEYGLWNSYRTVFRYGPRPPGPPPIEALQRELQTTARPYALDPEDAQPDKDLKKVTKSQSPFHLPKLTDEDWERRHDQYVKENGYEIRIPNWDDIIHLNLPIAVSKDQYQEYKTARKQGRKPNLPDEMIEYLDKRRAKYKTYLGTPQPRWYRSYASIMTALDDAQDALSSAVVLGKLAIRSAPRALSRLLGPLSWTMTASELINIANKTMRAPWNPRRAKRRLWDMTRENPFANIASIKQAGALANPINWPAALIEMAQVADNLLGVGLCIGPIFGTAADAVFGGLRAISGEPVSIYLPGQDKPAIVLNASKNLKSAHAAAITNPMLQDDDRIMLLLSVALSANILRPHLKGIHATDRIPKTKDLIISAPKPRKPDTIDILQEAGYDPEDTARLPLLDVKEALYDEWALDIHSRITTSNDLHLTSMLNPEMGYFGAVLTHHAALSTLAALTRPGSINLQLRPDINTLFRMLHNNLRPDPNATEDIVKTTLGLGFRQINNSLVVPRGKDIPQRFRAAEPLFQTRPDDTFPTTSDLTPEHLEYLEQIATRDRALEATQET